MHTGNNHGQINDMRTGQIKTAVAGVCRLDERSKNHDSLRSLLAAKCFTRGYVTMHHQAEHLLFKFGYHTFSLGSLARLLSI